MSEERDPGTAAAAAPAEEGARGVDRGDRIHSFEAPGIRVTWSRRRCIHAAACVIGLPRVFAPGRRPWVDPTQSSPEAIARVVAHCPTGALHSARSDGGEVETVPAENTIIATRDGPLYVRGDVEVFDESGARRLTDVRVALCRCGKSANKPLCDGAHVAAGFRSDGSVHPGAPMGDPSATHSTLRVRPQPDGPLRLEGPFTLSSAEHRTLLLGSSVSLCRCGRSRNKPFCDSSHLA